MERNDDAASARAGVRRRAQLGHGAGRLARAGAGRVRAAATADGAGRSGMSALLGAHALSSAGDALLAVALAGTVFFSVPLGEARDRVALYLLLTLLPFSLLVPVAVRCSTGSGTAAGTSWPSRPGPAGSWPGRWPGSPPRSGSTRSPSPRWSCRGRTGWPAVLPCRGCARRG